MEQRIVALEDELKVLKNQIQAVLLDIKEYMATGNGQVFAPAWEGADEVGATVGGGQDGPPRVLRQEPQSEGSDSGAEVAQPAPGARDAGGLPADGAGSGGTTLAVIGGSGNREAVDLLTVSVLAQWLSRAVEAVGRDQIGKLVEIYDITGNLPHRLKETIILLAEMYGDAKGSDEAPAVEYVPAAVSMQLLIELDSLLRYRKGALESVVLSMLLDKGLGGRKLSHG